MTFNFDQVGLNLVKLDKLDKASRGKIFRSFNRICAWHNANFEFFRIIIGKCIGKYEDN